MTGPASGTLVLVVGASGVGKDTVISGARDMLAGDDRFTFPRRIITRAPDTTENHVAVTLDQFSRLEACGAFALSWAAHGLHYAIPAAIDRDLAAGRVVVCNVSRQVIAPARATYLRTFVVEVRASVAIRAQRLTLRQREAADAIAARLAHDVHRPYAPDHVVDNEGELPVGIASFVACLRAL
jgi:phosphonate metabolism protein PhnN/1,5-bisphosphokinase (PRPP-forming)